MKKFIPYTAIFIVSLMMIVGFYGLVFSTEKNYYQNLTPLNLIITTICLAICAKSNYSIVGIKNWISVFILICVIGFLIEVIGVKSKLIFGEYFYGNKLGPKLIDVPLIIGLNWGLLIFCVVAITHKLYSNLFMRAAVGASLMVLLDILIEPIAFSFNWWGWGDKTIPLQNYFAWWLISFALLITCFKLLKQPENKSGIWIYSMQIIFFSLLNLLL